MTEVDTSSTTFLVTRATVIIAYAAQKNACIICGLAQSLSSPPSRGLKSNMSRQMRFPRQISDPVTRCVRTYPFKEDASSNGSSDYYITVVGCRTLNSLFTGVPLPTLEFQPSALIGRRSRKCLSLERETISSHYGK